DRSGLAATLYLNIYQGLPLDQAQRQGLTWRYGHFTYQAGALDRFFDLYRQQGEGLGLREWIETRYPAIYAAQARVRKGRGALGRPAFTVN
ncbi:MAG TPA: hypothetical protein VFU47_08785, partial [Armatimonadota bacterium]|nr:hypothetical protein [Armatimonadota bacterium]